MFSAACLDKSLSASGTTLKDFEVGPISGQGCIRASESRLSRVTHSAGHNQTITPTMTALSLNSLSDEKNVVSNVGFRKLLQGTLTLSWYILCVE